MSGGSLNYWNAEEPIEKITEEYLFGKNRFTESTLKEFRNAISVLRKAEIYAHRIEWLLSGDDGEDNFVERLKKDLDDLEKENSKEIPCLIQSCPYCENFNEYDKKCDFINWYDGNYRKEFINKGDSSECYDFKADYEKKWELLHNENIK